MRIAVLNKNKCNYKECNYLCMRFCPKVKTGTKTITISEENFPEINEELCTGCGICINKCPNNAISIINLPEELKNPIHQYGKNSFRLYNFLYPKEGVIGIVGRNGTGKSTILKILSGNLKINLGNFDKDLEFDEIIEYFRGKEIQKFFIEISNFIKDKKNYASYKPQYVEGLRKILKGNVSQIIENLKKKTNSIIDKEKLLKDLGIDFLNKNIDELSGGELQKLAIFACLSKDAEIYLLDEPSSYLDIEERLNFVKVIENFVSLTKNIV
ncbi:MAG: ATP-binding cassette domain-containing protein, partial [Candidatus Altarchaeaceae archaeon]